MIWGQSVDGKDYLGAHYLKQEEMFKERINTMDQVVDQFEKFSKDYARFAPGPKEDPQGVEAFDKEGEIEVSGGYSDRGESEDEEQFAVSKLTSSFLTDSHRDASSQEEIDREGGR